MRIFGFEITRAKSAQTATSVDRGWWTTIYDRWPGAWQQVATPVSQETILAYHAVYACVTLISNDIGKLRHKLVEKSDSGVWTEVQSAAFSPVLRRPNNYQNAVQFREWWSTSKLLRGNAYALKRRDSRGVVTALYLLDPTKVRPLVTPETEVFYEIEQDNMAGVVDRITVPASEIIHDRMNCLFHPLIGVSPIYASGSAATIGVTIQGNQEAFFGNASTPGGILTAPGAISPETATRLKDYWDENFAGDNSGKVAVVGDGLKFEPLRMSAQDAQMIEALKWTADVVCSAFHVPPFKVGLGQMPTYQNAEVLNAIYYSDCLQTLIEQYEACMDEGLGLDGVTRGTELDLRGLLRMDSATQIKTLAEAVSGGILTPNEARAELDRKPLDGGDTVYLQEQYYSLEALAERDASQPFAKPAPAAPAPAPDPGMTEDQARAIAALIEKTAASETLSLRTAA